MVTEHTHVTVAEFYRGAADCGGPSTGFCVCGVLVYTNTNSILTEAPLFSLRLNCPEFTPTTPPCYQNVFPLLSHSCFPLLRFLSCCGPVSLFSDYNSNFSVHYGKLNVLEISALEYQPISFLGWNWTILCKVLCKKDCFISFIYLFIFCFII